MTFDLVGNKLYYWLKIDVLQKELRSSRNPRAKALEGRGISLSRSKPLRFQLKLTLNGSVLPCLLLTCTFLPLKPGYICNCNHFTNQRVWLGSVPKRSISHQWRWHNFNLKPWFLSIQHWKLIWNGVKARVIFGLKRVTITKFSTFCFHLFYWLSCSLPFQDILIYKYLKNKEWK